MRGHPAEQLAPSIGDTEETMKILTRIALILLITGTSPALALAASDFEDFGKLLGKTTLNGADAFEDFQKAKVACVCRTVGANQNVAGVILRTPFTTKWAVGCSVPTFDAQGKVSLLANCFDWELLTN
jgi:hypothetical protein